MTLVDEDVITFKDVISLGVGKPKTECSQMPFDRLSHGEFLVASEGFFNGPNKLSKPKKAV